MNDGEALCGWLGNSSCDNISSTVNHNVSTAMAGALLPQFDDINDTLSAFWNNSDALMFANDILNDVSMGYGVDVS